MAGTPLAQALRDGARSRSCCAQTEFGHVWLLRAVLLVLLALSLPWRRRART